MELKFPIAETFYSIQGEGVYAGTPMFFIRMAGCNVGRYTSGAPSLGQPEGNNLKTGILQAPFQILHPEYATCTSFNGQSFICDTDYRVKERLTIAEIIDRAQDSGAKHVNITGGEPFMHAAIGQLITAMWNELDVLAIHVETSGTVKFPDLRDVTTFITCSPKRGFLPENAFAINQWKFLVQNTTDELDVIRFLTQHDLRTDVYIQPIDPMDASVERTFCVECVKRHPTWALSIQMHKVLGVR